MSSKGIITIVLCSVLIVLLTASLVITLIITRTDWDFDKEGKPILFEKTFTGDEAAKITSVRVEWQAGRLSILPSSDDTLYVKHVASSSNKPLECEIDATGELRIIDSQGWRRWFFQFPWLNRDAELTVMLPKKEYENFLLSNASGKTTVESVASQLMSITSHSGTLTASDLKAEECHMKVTSGDTRITGLTARTLVTTLTSGRLDVTGAIGGLNTKTTSGNCSIATTQLPETLEAKVTSGNVKLTIPDSEGFTLYCDKSSGSFRSNFELTTMLGDDSAYWYADKAKAANREYRVKITSGNLTLNKAD